MSPRVVAVAAAAAVAAAVAVAAAAVAAAAVAAAAVLSPSPSHHPDDQARCRGEATPAGRMEESLSIDAVKVIMRRT